MDNPPLDDSPRPDDPPSDNPLRKSNRGPAPRRVWLPGESHWVDDPNDPAPPNTFGGPRGPNFRPQETRLDPTLHPDGEVHLEGMRQGPMPTKVAPQVLRLRQIDAAIQMSIAGETWETIAAALGWNSGPAAYGAVKSYRDRLRSSIEDGLEERRQIANERLDWMRRQVVAVMLTPHYMYYNGKPILDEDGNRVRDDAPRLAAIDRFLKIEERAAKNNGTDHTQQHEIALKRRIELESTLATEAVLAGFEALNLNDEQRRRALEAAQEHMIRVATETVES